MGAPGLVSDASISGCTGGRDVRVYVCARVCGYNLPRRLVDTLAYVSAVPFSGSRD